MSVNRLSVLATKLTMGIQRMRAVLARTVDAVLSETNVVGDLRERSHVTYFLCAFHPVS